MSDWILIAGTGKMARDIGVFFISRGFSILWISRNWNRLQEIEKWVGKKIRRLEQLGPHIGCHSIGSASFYHIDDSNIPQVKFIIECINESKEEKREILKKLERCLCEETLIVTNSSSLYPENLHPRVFGLHFFYPVELTGFVEVVFRPNSTSLEKERLFSLLHKCNLECIEEEKETAFIINRLLMPVQTESLLSVMAGGEPALVDKASCSAFLPIGQLSLMDTIGLDVLYPAVENYMSYMAKSVAFQYVPLREGLAQLLSLGKKGKKNKDGICMGSPLPWPQGSRFSELYYSTFSKRIECLFVNTCLNALDYKMIDESYLSLALCSLFGWDRPFREAIQPLVKKNMTEILFHAYEETKRLYYIPSKFFRNRENCQEVWPESPLLI